MSFTCLGLSILGACQYDPSNPANIYFTLGDAIAALSITLLIPQFVRPIYVLRLNIRRYPISYIYITVFSGTFAVLVGTILPHFGGVKQWIVDYPIFWEIIGMLLFSLAYAALAYAFISPAKITPNTIEKFAKYAADIIAQGSERDFIDLAEELEINVGALSRASRQPTSRQRSAFYDFTHRQQIVEASYAGSLLHIASDPAFCSTLISRAPWRAAYIVRILSEPDSSSDAAKKFVQEIFRQSMLSPQSMIGRETEYKGFRAAPILSEALFENDFCNHYYAPFSGFNYRDFDGIGAGEIKRINHAARLSTKAAFEANNCWDAHNWHYIKECYVSLLEQTQILRSNSRSSVYFRIELSSGIRDLINLANDYLAGLSDSEMASFFCNSSDTQFDDSIISEISEIAFESLNSISNDFEGWSDPLWQHALNIFRGIYTRPERADLNPLQQRVSLLIQSKLRENMQGRYPALMRVLISLIGPYGPSTEKIGDAHRLIVDATYTEILKLKKLAEDRPESYKDYLPNTVEFNAESNTLTFNYRFRDRTVLDLNTLNISAPSFQRK
ncbi:MAG: hypothetical protein VW600_10930 [Ferrovibrio sp.]